MKSFEIKSRKYGVFTVLLDDEDFERAGVGGRWSLAKRRKRYYVRRTKGTDHGYLHNFILGVVGVDHINGNGLDNRKENLRVASPLENAQNQRVRSDNTSGYRGVHWDRLRQKWRVSVDFKGRCQFAKRFNSLADAVVASKRARRELQPFCVEARLP